MATLTVWKLDSAGGAENALALLERMQKQELLQINDGAYVYWPAGKKKPKTQQMRSLTGGGAPGVQLFGGRLAPRPGACREPRSTEQVSEPPKRIPPEGREHA
jgi:uncharacterized membrane protein